MAALTCPSSTAARITAQATAWEQSRILRSSGYTAACSRSALVTIPARALAASRIILFVTRRARKEECVVPLTDPIGVPVEIDRRKRASGGNDRPAARPRYGLFWRALGPRCRVRKREDDWSFVAPGHRLDDLACKESGRRGGADKDGRPHVGNRVLERDSGWVVAGEVRCVSLGSGVGSFEFLEIFPLPGHQPSTVDHPHLALCLRGRQTPLDQSRYEEVGDPLRRRPGAREQHSLGG